VSAVAALRTHSDIKRSIIGRLVVELGHQGRRAAISRTFAAEKCNTSIEIALGQAALRPAVASTSYEHAVVLSDIWMREGM